ncbi:hypothetical protein CYLTODRAFT_346834 [Cylindrobasidium torrendii FP15055 ss-10]|uniref:Uncharacterized protein n=1 Tax=Cylindrobasidium torrendii FP15055 ss-10 TaxID=1314674 RepID=A0A0D7BN44_9AGAR|nr:hypothetical protein CYLTODRAFT_346834 [Cylindrobasidium torrendii FP15055 ss-10]
MADIQPKGISFLPADGVRATWTVRTPDMTVFLILAYGLLIYVFDVETKRFITTLRGHGNTITSLALDATKPNIFASTSRDFSTRIYDLGQPPRQSSDPVPTRHRGRVSVPSEALGHDVAGGEGDPMGVGRCILVLMGQGYSDNAFPVLQADFHPTLPLIATCCMDRTVRIWHIPACLPSRPLRQIHRPLFSSANIHPSAPLSIHWAGIDILCSHAAPIEKRYTEKEQGCLYVWKWLALSTYFPEGWEDEDQTRILCPSSAKVCAFHS